MPNYSNSPRNGHLPTRPSTSADYQLTESLNKLTLQHPNSPNSPSGRPSSAAVRSLSRRSSSVALDLRAARGSPSPGPQSPGGSDSSRLIRQSPSTPTIRKRSSMQSLSSTPPPPGGRSLSRKSSLLSLSSTIEKKPIVTFTPQPPALTAVILHDSSYKHRWARPGTKKADLATVVERPERIPAAVMGICAAQTRLGVHKLSIHKSKRMGSLFDPEVMLVHGGEGGDAGAWPKELAMLCRDVGLKFSRGECEVPPHLHQGDLYLCPESKEALEGCIGAVYDAVDAAFGGRFSDSTGGGLTKRSFACIRPPGHHCAETTPSGFCWLNNVHIAIAHAARVHGLTHAVILDFDLHHGDGSQSIAWALNDLLAKSGPKNPPTSPIPQIAYFSLHDINSYPCEAGDIEKIKNASLNLEAHSQFIQNMHLKRYTSVDEFWEIYDNHYSSLLAKAKEFLVSSMNAFRASKTGKGSKDPKAAIFLSSGFDASEHEGAAMQRHKVHVPTGFYARFAREVVCLAEDVDTGCEGRVVSVLEGGYSNRAMTSGVLSHLVGLAYETPSKELYRHNMQYHGRGSLSAEYDSSAASVDMDYAPHHPLDVLVGQGQGETVDYYDPSWWDIHHLTELERKEKKPKKPTSSTPVNYLSATASSSAKAESPRLAKAQQNAMAQTHGPPPPPIILDWATATVELSKKLIPQEDDEMGPPSPTGSVTSTRSVSTSKRHSVAGGETEGSRMTLRERKKPVIEERPPSRATGAGSSRRKTVVGVVTTTAGRSVSTSAKPQTPKAPSPLPSRGPSPNPGSRSATPSLAIGAARPPIGKRVASVGAAPPPNPRDAMPPPKTTKRLPGKSLEKVSSISDMREATSTATVTAAVPTAQRALRRTSSTSQMLTSAKQTSPPNGLTPGSKVSQTIAVRKPVAKKEEEEAAETSLVKGVNKITLTYKNAAADRAKLEEEKKARIEQQEMERLKKKADELENEKQERRKESEKFRKERDSQREKAKQEPTNTTAAPPSNATGVSAVRLAAMKLEQQQSAAAKVVPPPAASKTPIAPVTTASLKTLPPKNVTQQPPSPVIVTIPPTRPTSSYSAIGDAQSDGGRSDNTIGHESPVSDSNLLSPDYSPSISPVIAQEEPEEVYHHHHPQQNYTAHQQPPVFTSSSEIRFAPTPNTTTPHVRKEAHDDDDEDDESTSSQEAERENSNGIGSPPPPYSASAQQQQHLHQQVVNQNTQIVGLGFNVMKPLTVGLGGGVSRKSSAADLGEDAGAGES